MKNKKKKTNINLLIPEFDDCLDSASSISSKEILTNASINSTANSSPSKEDKKFVENNLSSNRNANTFSGSFSANTNFLTPINNKKNLQSPRSPRNPVTGEGINAPSSGRQKKMSYRRGIVFSILNYTLYFFCYLLERILFGRIYYFVHFLFSMKISMI